MNIERIALSKRAARHAALADVVRLAVVDELAVGDRSPSELQQILDVPSNLMAHHLKILESAGMVMRRKSEGDRRRTYLTLSDISVDEGDFSSKISAGRVVFVCSANSARSQLAAALWANASDVPVTSAGTHPAAHIAEGAWAVADRRSLTLASVAPRRFGDLVAGDDFVIAVCDNAYEELGPDADLHWSIPDPVSKGNDEAFDSAYNELERRITTLSSRLIAS